MTETLLEAPPQMQYPLHAAVFRSLQFRFHADIVAQRRNREVQQAKFLALAETLGREAIVTGDGIVELGVRHDTVGSIAGYRVVDLVAGSSAHGQAWHARYVFMTVACPEIPRGRRFVLFPKEGNGTPLTEEQAMNLDVAADACFYVLEHVGTELGNFVGYPSWEFDPELKEEAKKVTDEQRDALMTLINESGLAVELIDDEKLEVVPGLPGDDLTGVLPEDDFADFLEFIENLGLNVGSYAFVNPPAENVQLPFYLPDVNHRLHTDESRVRFLGNAEGITFIDMADCPVREVTNEPKPEEENPPADTSTVGGSGKHRRSRPHNPGEN